MSKHAKWTAAALAALAILTVSIPLLAGMSSANYQIPNDVISGGGSAMSSAGYQLVGTLGQSSPLGTASTPTLSYTNYPGFWQADECVFDGDTDGLTNAVEYGLGTGAYTPDSDIDGLEDGEELVIGLDGYTTDPLRADYDSDGLADGGEFTYGANPKSSDTDTDGLNDGEEATAGLDGFTTDLLYWDTDWDGMPDGFEASNVSGHTVNLNPKNSADGALTFDSDSNVNAHEYWNGSDPWAQNPVGSNACGYWGEADGDGVLGPGDKTGIAYRIKGIPFSYAAVVPPNGDTQELDMDGVIGPGDGTVLNLMIKSANLAVLASRPAALQELTSTCPATMAVGDTCRVSLSVINEATPSALVTSGIPVTFEVSVNSTGAATLFGGDGEYNGKRYDLSGTMIDNAPASVVVRPDAPGSVIISARIDQCGATENIGRYSPERQLVEFRTINVQ